MFGKMIYYDDKTVAEYYSYATGKPYNRLQNQSQENGLNAHLDILSASAGVSKNSTLSYQTTSSLLLECENFERLLAKREDFLDFTTHDEFDLDTANRGTIIKFTGYIEIPEQFDMVQIIDRFKPVLASSIDQQDWEQQNKGIAQAIFEGTDSFSIPLVFELEGRILCAKVKKDHLLVSYDDIEELTTDEVTVLGRLASGIIPKDKCFYDPLKDFMHLNRATRKKTPERIAGLEKLFLDSPYRNIDVLAIYN